MPEGDNNNGAGGAGDNKDGGLTEDMKAQLQNNWRSVVSEEYASHPATADIKDLNGLLKSYVNAQKLVGAEKLPKPSKKWGKQEWSEFNRQIGMPEKPTDYELQKYDNVAAEDEEWFRNFAHGELNLSNRQAQNLWASLQGRSAEKTENLMKLRKQATEEGFNKLKEEWGANYDARVKFTNEALARLDEDGSFRNWMKQTGLNQSPEMLKFAAKIAESFGEDRVGSGERSSMPMSKDAARAKATKMMSDAKKDPNHPLLNKKDPAHNDAVREYTRLAELAGGTK